MRIISNFNDYYDNGMMYGIDSQNVFSRINKNGFLKEENVLNYLSSIEWKNLSRDFLLQYVMTLTSASIQKILIGFCGRLYQCFMVRYYDETKKPLFFYTRQEAFLYLGENPRRFSFFEMRSGKHSDTEIYFKDHEELFLKIKSPIFLLNGEGKISWYPRLANYSFQRLKDSAKAFSEIEFFNINTLKVTDTKMESVSDENKVIQHGFDDKISFRHRRKK